MNKKAARYSLVYFLIATFAFILLPKQTIGDIYLVSAHFIICIVLIYFIYRKPKVL